MRQMKVSEFDMSTVAGRWQYFHATKDVDTFSQACRSALLKESDDANVVVQHAETFGMAGDFDGKLYALQNALDKWPKSMRARLAMGLELLSRGKHKEAWPYYRARFSMKNVTVRDNGLLPSHRWKGQNVEGKSILLVKEQGLGDTLQFIRYSSRLKDLGAKTFINVQPALRSLFEQSPAVGKVLRPRETIDFHYWAYLQELLPFIEETYDDVSWSGSYINAPASAVPFVSGLGSQQNIRVGLAWKGNPNFPGNALRSVELEDLSDLKATPKCQFYSLMPKHISQEIHASEEHDWVADISGLTWPFEELARAVDAMDVVVTVCTSIAHLAGSMGKPTILLIGALNDWRWGRVRQKTRWYPSVTLVRQKKIGSWSEPVGMVRDLLCAF